ncbi:MerC domain-containing protein [uncultured Algimonas sp.]|uniref:MerC domain-containing protein n=1 Tax=uncultured Algimonas sp. TaxID=1547920 RepID=UPI00262343E9|nr:MerC domain-containing protein [uncultured Algimonas sp.]
MKSSALTVDKIAVTLSALCVVHCLLLPILATTLPLLGLWAENEWVHKAFVLAALPLSAVAFVNPVRLRFGYAMRGFALLGAALLVAGAFAEALHDYETVLTVVGASCLAAAHLTRIRMRSHVHLRR